MYGLSVSESIKNLPLWLKICWFPYDPILFLMYFETLLLDEGS